jgi:hypothetical protein
MQEARGEIVRADTLWILVGFLRLALTVAIVVGFAGPPTAVALAMVCASFIGLLAQKRSPAATELGPLFTRWRFTGWGAHYRDARWTASTPVQNFAQTNLPVLALSLFAPAAVIPTFVVLRALFGFARLAIQNLGRFLSARYVLSARADDREEATVRLLVMAGVAAWLGLGLCLAVYAENGWITIPWFQMQALNVRPYLMAAFSAAALCAVATIFSLSLGRDGRIKAAGGANYLYAGLNLAAALGAILTRDVLALAGGILAAEFAILVVALRLLLRPPLSPRLRRARNGLIAAGLGFLAIIALGAWLLPLANFGRAPDLWSVALSGLIALLLFALGGLMLAAAMGAEARRLLGKGS